MEREDLLDRLQDALGNARVLVKQLREQLNFIDAVVLFQLERVLEDEGE